MQETYTRQVKVAYEGLTTMSPCSKRIPARDEGLSPVKVTTLQEEENPYFPTKYSAILP